MEKEIFVYPAVMADWYTVISDFHFTKRLGLMITWSLSGPLPLLAY